MDISGIYQIQSKSKKWRSYIGSAKNISKRWGMHLRSLRKNKHHSGKLQNHYNKYGEADLIFSIILGCDQKDLISLEQYFIDSYNPYFNIYKTAGSPKGYKHSDESKKKISESNSGIKNHNFGKIFSEDIKHKMRDARKGYVMSGETRKKISIKTKGVKKPKSTEHRKKLSEANKGNKLLDQTKRKISESLKGRIPWNKGMKKELLITNLN